MKAKKIISRLAIVVCGIGLLLALYRVVAYNVIDFGDVGSKTDSYNNLSDVVRELKIEDVDYGDDNKLYRMQNFQVSKDMAYYSDEDSVYLVTEEGNTLVKSTDGSIEDFYVHNNTLYYLLCAENESQIIRSFHQYDIETSNDIVIKDDGVFCFAVGEDGKVVYIASPTMMDTVIYSFDSISGESTSVYEMSIETPRVDNIYMYGSKVIMLTEYLHAKVFSYDIETGEFETVYRNKSRGAIMSCCISDEGFYLSVQCLASDDWKGYIETDSDDNGVWYRRWDGTELEKISGDSFEELYCISGSLFGINDEKTSRIDTSAAGE